ncbi:InlB B-repeat-containing protein [Peptoniphilus equinus]|uniref:InlB B-repeat-containing protein n=1 Tax=Peptoniphilus equinus TaxID=3016343 RepID=A0ABY7QU98_9FIRM|nr:InlB B-repeat-containing protein [Peptoniphilus equinus]WBW49748.1 InlB B-repeat-containing protein [Peptoniphilus equinus]
MDKRVGKVALALVLLGGTVTPALAQEMTVPRDNVKIQWLVDKGWVIGRGDVGYELDKTITRAEFTKMIVVGENLEASAETKKVSASKFTDVDTTYWANGYINAAVEKGFIKGYEDGTFRPDDKIKYSEILAMLSRLHPAFKEVTTVEPWYAPYVTFSKANGILEGVDIPNQDYTLDGLREETFELIYNLYHNRKVEVAKKTTVTTPAPVYRWVSAPGRWEVGNIVPPHADYHRVNFYVDGSLYSTQTTREYVTAPKSPVKSGKTFIGWVDSLGSRFNFTAPVYRDINLYARFEETVQPVESYYVNFNTAGGSAVNGLWVTKGQTVARPADPTRPGYTFLGWTLNGDMYRFNTPVYSNMTLTASWTKDPVVDPVVNHTVTYDYNGGTGTMTTETVEDGKFATLPTPTTAPTGPDGNALTFEGWYDGETRYTKDMPVARDMTLKATWSMAAAPLEPADPIVVNHTVTYDYNGGTGTMTKETVEDGKFATLPTPITTPTDPNGNALTFEGWYDGETRYTKDMPVARDMTLKATWSMAAALIEPADPIVVNHTVTYDYNGGTGTMTTETVEDGKFATLPTPTTAPTDPDGNALTFEGWYDGETRYTKDMPVDRDMTLKATWSMAAASLEPADPIVVNHTVTYDYNGGTGTMTTETVEDGKFATLPTPTTAPTGPDGNALTFEGWYDGETRYTKDMPVARDMTLKATWSMAAALIEPAMEKRTVTFDTDGGTAVEPVTVTQGEVAEAPTAPTKTGFTFAGWTLQGEAYDFTAPINDNITLTAQWVKDPEQWATVTFKTFDFAEPVAAVEVLKGQALGTNPSVTLKYDEMDTFKGWTTGGDAPLKTDVSQDVVNGNTEYVGIFSRDVLLTLADGETLNPIADQQDLYSGIELLSGMDGTLTSRPLTDDEKTELISHIPYGYKLSTAAWASNLNTFEITRRDGTETMPTVPVVLVYVDKFLEFTATFNTDGGTPQPKDQTIREGGSFTRPQDPQKEGFTFLEWRVSGETKAFDFATPPKTGVNLVAIYKENPVDPTLMSDADKTAIDQAFETLMAATVKAVNGNAKNVYYHVDYTAGKPGHYDVAINPEHGDVYITKTVSERAGLPTAMVNFITAGHWKRGDVPETLSKVKVTNVNDVSKSRFIEREDLVRLSKGELSAAAGILKYFLPETPQFLKELPGNEVQIDYYYVKDGKTYIKTDIVTFTDDYK